MKWTSCTLKFALVYQNNGHVWLEHVYLHAYLVMYNVLEDFFHNVTDAQYWYHKNLCIHYCHNWTERWIFCTEQWIFCTLQFLLDALRIKNFLSGLWYNYSDNYKFTCSDWLRIASYLAIITLCEVTITGALNFTTAASYLTCQCFGGSDKCNSRKFNFEEHKKYH